MKNRMYKDIRSMKTWLNNKTESANSTKTLLFQTLTSLTPERISARIREYYVDLESPNNTRWENWENRHYSEYPHPILKTDADDQRLISIILFLVDYILTARIYKRMSYDKISGTVSIPVAAYKHLYNQPSYLSHAVDVAVASFILQIASGHNSTKHIPRRFRIHPFHLTLSENPLVTVKCPHKGVAENILEKILESPDTDDTLDNADDSDKRVPADVLPEQQKRTSASDTMVPTDNSDKQIAKDITPEQQKQPDAKARRKQHITEKVQLVSLYNLYHLRVNYAEALKVLQLKLAKDLRRERLLRRLGVQRRADVSSDSLDVINGRYYNGLISINKLNSDYIFDKFVTADANGRLHSNLTNFPKEIRHLLTFDGCGEPEPLAMIDMSNSQPFLLINLIMEFLSEELDETITTRRRLEKYCVKMGYTDVMRYVEVVENANFYKECHRLRKGYSHLKEITPAQKEKARVMIFTALFFGDGSTEWQEAIDLAAAFSNEYPTVRRVIDHFRPQGNHAYLSHRLQQEEARLFIDKILTKLIVREKRPHILSLHDGFLAPASSVDHIIELFKHEYNKTGFQVKLKVDYYATGEKRVETINERPPYINGGRKRVSS